MDNIKATPRNEVLGGIADLLTKGKTAANQYQILPQIPLIGGTGLGDLFMGKAPELLDNVSYDGIRAALRGGNLATGGIGTYGARPEVADAAMLGLDVVGLGKGLSGLSKKSASAIYEKLLEGGTSLSRRDALKKLGAISGSTVAAGTGVGALRKLSDNIVSEALHTTPKLADNVAATVAKKYKFNSLADYFAYVKNQAAEEGNIAFHEHGASDMGWDNWEEIFYDPKNPSGYDNHLKRILKQDEEFYNTHKTNIAAGKEPTPWSVEVDPHTGKYTSVYADEVLSPTAKQEMKDWKTGVQKMNDDYGTNSGQHPDWSQWVVNSNNDTDTLQVLRDYVKDVSFQEK